MALALYDRVQQTGTANTTVSFTLSGSVTGYQSFSVVGNGNTTYYGATDTSGNWEVGIGTYSTTGPTLTRTTILSSSNSGSAVTFSGTVTVFVTYPSGKSVNLDGSGNVSALGTVASGTWNGSTIPVAYGGTGVTTSSGASSVVLRDANQNVTFNNFTAGFAATTASGGTTVLTVASARNQVLIGSTTHTFQMPNATTLQIGQSFIFVNNSSGVLTITDNASATLDTVPSGGAVQLGVTSIATSAGSWGIYSFLPGSYNFNSTTATFNNAAISDAVWNGTTIASGYGGTGLTTFTAANNALYSTSASALAAGTLPIAAGGTSATTAAAAFNALSPMTTTGDIIYEASAGTAARLPIGTSGQVLSVSGGIPAWAAAPGSSTLNIQDFTATSGQTSFTVTYTVGLVEGVYRNGIKLGTADYVATSGTAIVLGTGAITGDLIQVVYFTSAGVSAAAAYTRTSFTASAAQTTFTVSYTPGYVQIYVNGVLLNAADYTASNGTSVVLAVACNSGDIVETVAYTTFSVANTVSSFSAGTTGLTPSSTSSGAITLAGTLAVANGGTGVTTSTGSGNNVLSTSPSLTTPSLTTPSIAGATSGNITLAVPAVAGTNTITFPASTGTVFLGYPVNYLMAAGGGGGGGSIAAGGGAAGGGAGGLISSTLIASSGTVYTITVGAGGAGGIGSASPTAATNSSITGLTAAVAGGAGGYNNTTSSSTAGTSGGSGGGGAYRTSTGASGTSGQGNAGGGGLNTAANYPGGGGGGSGTAGASASSGTVAGAGGDGTSNSITGSAVIYAAGGGGGTYVGGTAGAGGSSGVGGAGGVANATGGAGTVNTGSGGGGSGCTASLAGTGGAGGSGVVILSIPTVYYSGTTTGSPTVTTSGSNTILKYTSSGTYTA
jgi:hypothetical protein